VAIQVDPALYRVDDARFGRRMLEQAAFFVAGAWLAFAPSVWLKLLGSVLLGVAFARNLEFAHECIHGTALRSRRWNHVVGTVLCLPMLVSFVQWRREHAQHHADVRREGFRYEYARLSGWRELLLHVFMVRHFGRAVRQMTRTDHVAMLALPVGLALLSVVLRSPVVVWMWLLPLAFGAVVHTHLELPEHFATGSGDAFESGWIVRAGRFATWFANANNYHALHHHLPRLPQASLAIVQVTFAGRARYTTTYMSFYRTFYRRVLRA
jgi:fatty acid desaturase